MRAYIDQRGDGVEEYERWRGKVDQGVQGVGEGEELDLVLDGAAAAASRPGFESESGLGDLADVRPFLGLNLPPPYVRC